MRFTARKLYPMWPSQKEHEGAGKKGGSAFLFSEPRNSLKSCCRTSSSLPATAVGSNVMRLPVGRQAPPAAGSLGVVRVLAGGGSGECVGEPSDLEWCGNRKFRPPME